MIKESRLLDNEGLSVIGYALCAAFMCICMQVCIEFLQYAEPFLRRGDPHAGWLTTLYIVGVMCAFVVIGIALSRIYIILHERRSFEPISY